MDALRTRPALVDDRAVVNHASCLEGFQAFMATHDAKECIAGLVLKAMLPTSITRDLGYVESAYHSLLLVARSGLPDNLDYTLTLLMSSGLE